MVTAVKLDDKLILMYLPYALARVDQSKDLMLDELHAYKRQSPDFFVYVKSNPLEKHIKFLESHRRDTYYGQYVERILSPVGLKWLRKNYPMIEKVANEGK
jgi:hypothetical protein